MALLKVHWKRAMGIFAPIVIFVLIVLATSVRPPALQQKFSAGKYTEGSVHFH